MGGHDHDHAHVHAQHHGPAAEDYAARSHPEYVVLDIGGEYGALIVHTDPAMHGIEVEISRSGKPRTGAHKQILQRRGNGGPAYTAVFDRLTEGPYTLWIGDEARASEVEVAPAEVAELDWRTADNG